MKYMKIHFLLFTLSSGALAESQIAGLLDLRPGENYVPPAGAEMVLDKERPTTQFQSPNNGVTSAIFPTYELALINGSGTLAIVTANAPTPNLEECQDELGKVSEILNGAFEGFTNTPASQSQLGGSNEYSSTGQDAYYVLECHKMYGPFWTLHFQIRSKAQDKLLKLAWENYFESRS